MNRTFAPQMSILPSAQQRLWPALKPALSLNFVLYGGTAIALRLAHRPSVDFDFFSDQSLEKEKLRSAFPFIAQATVLQDELETFTVLVKDSVETKEQYVKLSFFGHLSFGRVGEPELTSDGVMAVASMDDLMAHKLKVILQRIESKDYIDIAALIKVGVNLERGLSAAMALYGKTFQPSESLKALTYFQGGDLELLSSETKERLILAASQVRDLPQVTVLSRQLIP